MNTAATPTKTTNIDQVRTALLDTLADLRNRERPMDLDRARAVAQVASVLVDTARVENEYLKITDQTQSTFLDKPDDTETLPNGITAITRHRIAR